MLQSMYEKRNIQYENIYFTCFKRDERNNIEFEFKCIVAYASASMHLCTYADALYSFSLKLLVILE